MQHIQYVHAAQISGCMIETHLSINPLIAIVLSAQCLAAEDRHSYGVVMNVAGPMNVHPVNVNTRPAMIKTRGAFCKHVKREEEVDGTLLRYSYSNHSYNRLSSVKVFCHTVGLNQATPNTNAPRRATYIKHCTHILWVLLCIT